MDELIKAIQTKYIDEVTSKFPISRVIGLLMILISLTVYNPLLSEIRLLDKVDSIKIKFIFDFDNGLIANISLLQLFISAAISELIHIIYLLFKKKSFQILSKTSNFQEYINNIKSGINIVKSDNETVNFFISKDISKQLTFLRSQLRKFHSFSELLFVLIVCVSWSGYQMNYKDIMLITISCLIIMFNQWKSFKFYVNSFLPYYISEQVLLGGSITFGDE